MTPTESRVSWTDERLDRLSEKVDDDFALREEDLRELRSEVKDLTRQKPPLFGRWRLTGWSQLAPYSQDWTAPYHRSVSPTGLSWTDGRLDDLQTRVTNASARLSKDVAEVRAVIKNFEKEASRRRFKREMLLWDLYLVVIVVAIWIYSGAVAVVLSGL